MPLLYTDITPLRISPDCSPSPQSFVRKREGGGGGWMKWSGWNLAYLLVRSICMCLSRNYTIAEIWPKLYLSFHISYFSAAICTALGSLSSSNLWSKSCSIASPPFFFFLSLIAPLACLPAAPPSWYRLPTSVEVEILHCSAIFLVSSWCILYVLCFSLHILHRGGTSGRWNCDDAWTLN